MRRASERGGQQPQGAQRTGAMLLVAWAAAAHRRIQRELTALQRPHLVLAARFVALTLVPPGPVGILGFGSLAPLCLPAAPAQNSC